MSIYKPTWLYIKQHNQTGLKYFGKTTNDPLAYLGSGTYWKRHLKKHGTNVTTIWCHLYFDEKELVDDALSFSKAHCIVESSTWANLADENGLDGAIPGGKQPKTSAALKGRIPYNKGKPSPLKGKSSSQKGIPKPKVSEALKGQTAWNKGVPMTEDQKIKLRTPKERFVCPHCGSDIGGKANFIRYHGDRCKARS